MRLWLSLLLSLLALTASASPGQPYFVRQLSASVPSGPTLTDIPGLYSWWVSSDYPTNTQVTNWVARISGVGLTNNLVFSPTNTATGMSFVTSNWFGLTVPSVGSGIATTNVWLVIMQPDTQPIDYTSVLGFSDTGRGLFLRTSKQFFYSSTFNTSFGAYTVGSVIDLTMELNRQALGTAVFMTNGVACASFSEAGSRTWSTVGFQQTFGYYKGKILEIAQWTNILSSVNISNIHYYATNTYKFTP